MSEIVNFLSSVLATLVRLTLWALATVLALFLLGLALLLLLIGGLWALLRGQRPTAPVMVGRFQRYASERVWRGAMGARTGAPPSHTEVVDVEVREVDDTTFPGDRPTLPPRHTDD